MEIQCAHPNLRQIIAAECKSVSKAREFADALLLASFLIPLCLSALVLGLLFFIDLSNWRLVAAVSFLALLLQSLLQIGIFNLRRRVFRKADARIDDCNRLYQKVHDGDFFVILRSFRPETWRYVEYQFTSPEDRPLEVTKSIIDELCLILRDYGACVLLGHGGTFNQEIGCFIIECSNADWRDTVVNYVDKAKLVFCFPDITCGIREEVEILTSDDRLSKSIILMPPLKGLGLRAPAKWNQITESYIGSGWRLPVYEPDGVIFRPNKNLGISTQLPSFWLGGEQRRQFKKELALLLKALPVCHGVKNVVEKRGQ